MGIHGRAEYLTYFEEKMKPTERALVRLEFEKIEDRLFRAVDDDDLELVRYLLDSGACPNWMNSFTRETLLSAAVSRGRLEIAMLARAYGAELVSDYEDPPAANQPSEELLSESTGNTRRWLCSAPPADRSTAPPVSEQPFAVSEELFVVVKEWRQLQQLDRYEALVETMLSRGLIDAVDHAKAVASARAAQTVAPAIVVHPAGGIALHPGHQDRFPASMARWRRHALIVGKLAVALQRIYAEVAFRPQHSGAKAARDDFEARACAQDEVAETSTPAEAEAQH